MKLELKHIIGYLPHRLKGAVLWEYKAQWFNVELYGVIQDDLQISNPFGGFDYCDISDFKPILRPLSDLTKEIEANGEKFVPIEWLDKNIKPTKHQSPSVCFTD